MIDIEKLEHLPKREPVNKSRRLNWNHWSSKHCDDHSINGISPYKRAIRIINKFIGKSFGDAFSFYCKQVPKYQQYIFLSEVEPYRRWKNWVYIDEFGNIQKYVSEKTKKSYFICSKDHETARLHKVTKQDIESFSLFKWKWGYVKHPHWNHLVQTRFFKLNNGHWASEDEFVLTIISGWEKEVLKKSSEFKRYTQERLREEKKQERIKKLLKNQTVYNFLTRTELEKIRSKKEDLIKLYSHGFDENSFKGHPYHGKKQKK